MNLKVAEITDGLLTLEEHARHMAMLTAIAHYRYSEWQEVWNAIGLQVAQKMVDRMNNASPDEENAGPMMHRAVIMDARDLAEKWLKENPNEK